jgi:hypothetical protein
VPDVRFAVLTTNLQQQLIAKGMKFNTVDLPLSVAISAQKSAGTPRALAASGIVPQNGVRGTR